MEQTQTQTQMQKQKHFSRGPTYDRLPPQWENYPWFVTQMHENQIFYTLHDPQLLYRCHIPQLIGTRIRASFHGWLVLSNHPTWFLWNPLTSELICLPSLIHMKHEPDQCCLSSPPDDPTSVFLLATHRYPILTFCRLYCTRNKLKWAKFSYGTELRRIIGKNGAYLHDLTCCNGKVYAFNSDDDNDIVIEIDIAVEEKKVVMRLLSFVERPGSCFIRFSIPNGTWGFDYFLKGHCSELFYIQIDLEDETRDAVGDVQLYKLNMSNMTWEKMEDLKDAIMFLQVDSEYPVYYSPVITTGLAGYIHILDRMGKLLYSYHVKNRTISIASMSSLVPTSDVSSWGMLEYRLGGDHANFKQEDKGDGNIVVKSATISKPLVFDSKRTRTDESYLLNMPFHILESIMEQCVCVEYMSFRAASKLCHLAAPSVQWSNKTTLKRLQSYSVASPWLMVFDKYQGIITLSDLMMGDKYFIKTPQELMGNIRVHYSRYGWLLIEKVGGAPRRMMLFNPFTSDIRELPLEDNVDGCCFSAPPTSKDCMVVGCNLEWNGFSIHFVGQEQSLRRPYLELVGDVPYSFRFPTFHNKDIYALSNDGRLDVIRELDEEEYTLETVVAKPPGCVGSSYLVECEQHLLLLVVGILEECVDLFKLNDLTKEWEKLDGLGKHTIYIADTCFCIEAKTPETENKIYFSALHNGKIVFYSFNTLSYYTSDGKNIKGRLRNFLATKYQWHPHTWIEPSWS